MVDNKLQIQTEEMFVTIGAAKDIVLKKYLSLLSDCECASPDYLNKIEIGDNVSLFRVERIVFDKEENVQEKLATVYATALAMQYSSLTMILDSDEKGVSLYLGVAIKDFTEDEQRLLPRQKELEKYDKSLRRAFEGNFPGMTFDVVNNRSIYDKRGVISEKGKSDMLKSIIKKGKHVAVVSSIPAPRKANENQNVAFVQGLEKIVDSLRGKKYTMFIIADVMDNNQIEDLCAQYESIYTQLFSFKQSVETVGTSEGATDTESFIQGVTDTVNRSVTNTLTKGISETKTHTDTVGVSEGVTAGTPFVKGNTTLSYNHSIARSKTSSESKSKAETEGEARSLSSQNSVARALTSTTNESVQITHEDRTVRTLLERIDEQIKRLRSCEDFGLFDAAVYFLAEDYNTAVSAASTYKSVTRGENSSVEVSALNIWSGKTDVERIVQYLARFYHPEFLSFKGVDDEKKTVYLRTTAATLISGKEMALLMPLPKKSVSGLPVFECAEFARESFSEEQKSNDIQIGKVYHMHHCEENTVYLDMNSLSAHAFITGATGSGKSNTVHTLLDKVTNHRSKNKVKFMVIEPTKGEYKNVFGNRKDVSVYGTNPKISDMLRINPFAFPNDIHVLEHIDRLIEIFNACWPMYAAMPAVLKDAVIAAYEKCGWDISESKCAYEKIVYPDFSTVTECVEENINTSSYSADTKGDYIGSLVTRLHSLTNGINGMIFSSDEIDSSKLFDENVIVDLSRVGSLETKSLIMGILVIKLSEYRMAYATEYNAKLQHITVLEEAHNLLKRTSTVQAQDAANLTGKSVEMISNAIAEMRTYGEGFVIVDQSPTSVDIAAIKNTNTKIIMRLPEEQDRRLAGKSAALNDMQVDEISRLPKGVAVVYQNDWVEAVLCKVDKYGGKESPYKYSQPTEDTRFEIKRFRTEIIKFLLSKRSGVAFDFDYLRTAVVDAPIPSLEKLRFKNLLNEYEMSGTTAVWENFEEITNLTCKAFLDKGIVYHIVDSNSSVEELNRRLVELINQRLISEEIQNNLCVDICQCILKKHALEIHDNNLYAYWRKSVIDGGGLVGVF